MLSLFYVLSVKASLYVLCGVMTENKCGKIQFASDVSFGVSPVIFNA